MKTTREWPGSKVPQATKSACNGTAGFSSKNPCNKEAHPGGVLEWTNRPVLKTGVPHGTVGSNPTPSAIYEVYLIYILP